MYFDNFIIMCLAQKDGINTERTHSWIMTTRSVMKGCANPDPKKIHFFDKSRTQLACAIDSLKPELPDSTTTTDSLDCTTYTPSGMLTKGVIKDALWGYPAGHFIAYPISKDSAAKIDATIDAYHASYAQEKNTGTVSYAAAENDVVVPPYFASKTLYEPYVVRQTFDNDVPLYSVTAQRCMTFSEQLLKSALNNRAPLNQSLNIDTSSAISPLDLIQKIEDVLKISTTMSYQDNDKNIITYAMLPDAAVVGSVATTGTYEYMTTDQIREQAIINFFRHYALKDV